MEATHTTGRASFLDALRREKLAFEAIFSPRSSVEFTVYCLFTILLSQLSEGLAQSVPLFLSLSMSSVLLVLLFAFWWHRDRLRTRERSKKLAFQPGKVDPPPAKGLILLLSPYDPRDPNLTKEDKLKPLLDRVIETPTEQLNDTDFSAINLAESNLRPQIEAIKYHMQKGSLRDVWLIASKSHGNVKGSEGAAAILEKYLKRTYGERLNVHCGAELSVHPYDYGQLWAVAEKIFRNSGYKDDVLLADITGGTKMMSVALAMACIPPGRRMQYIDSARDPQGNPLPHGKIEPLVIDVDPILFSQ